MKGWYSRAPAQKWWSRRLAWLVFGTEPTWKPLIATLPGVVANLVSLGVHSPLIECTTVLDACIVPRLHPFLQPCIFEKISVRPRTGTAAAWHRPRQTLSPPEKATNGPRYLHVLLQS